VFTWDTLVGEPKIGCMLCIALLVAEVSALGKAVLHKRVMDTEVEKRVTGEPLMSAKLYALRYYICLLGPIALISGWELGGLPGRAATLVLYEIVAPLADILLGSGIVGEKLAGNRVHRVSTDVIWFQIPLYLWVVAHGTMLLWMTSKTVALRWFEIFCLSWASGLVTSVSIAVAHELLHRRSNVDRSLASFLLSTVMFGHYRIAHNEHHRRVATAEDFATARFNETPYEFVPRSVFGGLIFSFLSERNRLSAKGEAWCTFHNEFVLNWGMSIAFIGLIWLACGIEGVVAFICQALVAISVHEMTTYIEHYGLLRKRREDGKYEKVSYDHSWLAPQRLTNYLTFNVQIHPDHHMHALKPYEDLEMTKSPILPAGYPPMMLLAFVTPLWKRVIHPRLPTSAT